MRADTAADTRRRRRRGRSGEDRGLALLMTAGAMVALLVVAALVVDIGYAKQMRREAQASADAAALAAAQVMQGGGAYVAAATAARDIADTNLAPLDSSMWPTCTDPERPANYQLAAGTAAVTGECVSFDPSAQLVRVVLPTVDSPSFFGRVVDRERYDVDATASAMWQESASGDGVCGICAIGGAWFQQAGGKIDIDGGKAVYASRLLINTNSKDNRPTTLYYETSNTSNNKKYDYVQVDEIPNPFAAVTVDYSGVTMGSPENASCADLVPDRMWNQKVTISGSCTLTTSGNYYFRRGLQVSGSLKSAAGANVTLIFGCATDGGPTIPTKCNGAHTGNVDISGSLQLGDPYQGGVSLLWDETANGASVINYNGNIKLGGAYYSKSSTPSFGNGTFEATAIVYGGDGLYGNLNNGNIKITAQGGAGGGGGDGTVGLWR